jgi:hypothetical protein
MWGGEGLGLFGMTRHKKHVGRFLGDNSQFFLDFIHLTAVGKTKKPKKWKKKPNQYQCFPEWMKLPNLGENITYEWM